VKDAGRGLEECRLLTDGRFFGRAGRSVRPSVL